MINRAKGLLAVWFLICQVFLMSAFSNNKEKVIFDIDLTKGKAENGKVTGGKWDKGWKVVGDTDRLLWDTGYLIKDGYLEVWITMEGKISDSVTKEVGKMHWISLHGNEGLSAGRSYWQLRTGGAGYKFSKMRIKGLGDHGESTRCEYSFGDWTEWESDGKTIMHVKMEWKDGIPQLQDIKGKIHSCKSNEGNYKLTGFGGSELFWKNVTLSCSC
jgi:hypothetical protein